MVSTWENDLEIRHVGIFVGFPLVLLVLHRFDKRVIRGWPKGGMLTPKMGMDLHDFPWPPMIGASVETWQIPKPCCFKVICEELHSCWKTCWKQPIRKAIPSVLVEITASWSRKDA